MLATSNDFPFGIMDVAELLHLHIRRPFADKRDAQRKHSARQGTFEMVQ